MSTMKNFLKYLLLLVGFFILSMFLENGLINNMYATINGESNGTLVTSGESLASDLDVTVESAKASNVNGSLKVKITNTSGHFIEKCCAKVELFSKQNLLVATKYIDINNFEVNESRYYEIKFQAKEVARYAISLIESAPDKSNIIDILGWEIDLSNVFGMDLTKLKDLFSVEGMKSGLSSAWQFAVNVANSVPLWAWLIASGIVIWYMPKGFLFNIFPF